MRLKQTFLIALMLILPCALFGQAIPNGSAVDDIGRFEVGLNYNFFHANAPPGHCGCFSLNGGSGTFVWNLSPSWSAMADFMLAHANNVNNTGQNITIFNYLFGPRYTVRRYNRFVPYAEVMLGGAKEDVNVQFNINRNAFGFLAGGGVRTTLRPKLGMTIIQADWIHTRIPNAVNDRQNDIRISTGVTYSFGVK